jgi:preprotein translocase subunit SecG
MPQQADLQMRREAAERRTMAEFRLNTKTKRVGALVMWSGIAIVVLAALQFDRLDYAIDAFSRNPVERYFQIRGYHNGLASFTIWIGAILALVGLLWSYFYDFTIGKAARWIETGSPINRPLQKIAAPTVEPRLALTKPAVPPKLPSRSTNIVMLAAQSWLTIAASTVPGFTFVTEGKREALMWPGFIAAAFTVQTLIRMSSGLSGRALFLIAGSKLIIAYLAFGIGAIAALVNRGF